MRVEDMIFISVDDHLVEPPHLFEGRLPARFADRAPRVEHTDAGDDVWIFDGQTIPNIGLNAVAGRPKEEYGVNPTAFDEMRPGCYDVHERVKDMSAGGVLACMCFPSFPSFSGRLFLDCADKELALAVVQAYNDWHIDEWCGTYPGPLHPDGAAGALGSRAERGRGAAGREEGLPLAHVHGEPGDARAAELPRSRTGTRCGARSWRTGTILNVHLGSSGQLAVTAPDAPIDVMITLQPINICQAAADLVWSRVFKEFPDAAGRALGGRHRLDPVLPRPSRPHLRHAPRCGPARTSATARRPTCSASTSSRASSPTRSASSSATTSAIDNMCWEQDYPHSDSSWPHAPEELAAVAARFDVTDAEHRQDHARERDALVPLRSVRAPRRASSAPSARCAPRCPATTWRSARWTRAGSPARRR